MTAPAAIVLGDNALYAFALRSGGVLLVDAGPDFDDPERGPSWDDAVAQARAHGFAPRDVRTVLVTHAHVDHAGLAHRWAAEGARIAAGAADAGWIAGGMESLQRQGDARLLELRRHGCPDALVEALGRWRGRGRLRWAACPAGAIDRIAGPLALDLEGGEAIEAIPAPGHTPGNLVAWLPATRDLCSGDTLLATTIPTPGMHFPAAGGPRWPSLPPFLRSVRALGALGADRLLPGHGEPVAEPAPVVERFLAHHDRRGRRVRAALGALAAHRSDGPHGVTAFEIARRLFPRLPDRRFGQAMTEVIGHLDLLEESGAARAAERDGVRRYEPAIAAGGGLA